MNNVIAEETDGEDATVSGALDAARSVQGEHVEADDVAGFDIPSEDGVSVAGGFDVGQVGEGAFGKPLGFVAHERAGHEPFSSAIGSGMRAGDEFEGGLAVDGINADPHADVHPAIDIVVGLILVPGGALAGAGFFGEHVIVIQADGFALHELTGDGGDGRLEDEAAVVIVGLPIAEVLDKAAGVLWAARDFRAGAGSLEVCVDAAAEESDFVRGEQLAEAYGTVTLKGGDVFGCHSPSLVQRFILGRDQGMVFHDRSVLAASDTCWLVDSHADEIRDGPLQACRCRR